MTTHNWQPFLKRWSREIVACKESAEWNLPQEAIEAEWLGYPPASLDKIHAAEERLGLTLPPSYRAFLEVSNGWLTTGHFIDRLWPVSGLHLLTERHADFVESWSTMDARAQPVVEEDYQVYEPGRAQPSRMIYLQTAVELGDSDLGDIYCLLNPQISFPDGEYEIWFYDIEIIGNRFRSFWDFMRARHDAFLITNKPTISIELAPEPEQFAARLPELIAALEAVSRRYRGVRSPNEAELLSCEGFALENERVSGLVKNVNAESTSPREIAERLGELVVTLEREWDEMERLRMAGIYERSANYSKQKADEDMIYHGRVHGLKRAIAPIRWFHYETA